MPFPAHRALVSGTAFDRKVQLPTKLPLQPSPRNPLVLRETDALTVKASAENREAVRINFSEKSANRAASRQQANRVTRASRAAQSWYLGAPWHAPAITD